MIKSFAKKVINHDKLETIAKLIADKKLEIKETIGDLKSAKRPLSQFWQDGLKKKQKELKDLLRKERNLFLGASTKISAVAAVPVGVGVGSKKLYDKYKAKKNPKIEVQEEGNINMSVKLNVAKLIYESNDIQTRDKINMLKDVKYMSEDEVLVWLDETLGRKFHNIGRKVLSKDTMRDIIAKTSKDVKSSKEKVEAIVKRNDHRKVWERFRKDPNLGKEITDAANKDAGASYSRNVYA